MSRKIPGLYVFDIEVSGQFFLNTYILSNTKKL